MRFILFALFFIGMFFTLHSGADTCTSNSVVITQGESPVLSMTALNGASAFDITGASIVTNFLKNDGSTELSISSGSHTVTSGSAGTFTISLTDSETEQIQVGAGKTFNSVITIGGKDYYLWADGCLRVRSSLIRKN